MILVLIWLNFGLELLAERRGGSTEVSSTYILDERLRTIEY